MKPTDIVGRCRCSKVSHARPCSCSRAGNPGASGLAITWACRRRCCCRHCLLTAMLVTIDHHQGDKWCPRTSFDEFSDNVGFVRG